MIDPFYRYLFSRHIDPSISSALFTCAHRFAVLISLIQNSYYCLVPDAFCLLYLMMSSFNVSQRSNRLLKKSGDSLLTSSSQLVISSQLRTVLLARLCEVSVECEGLLATGFFYNPKTGTINYTPVFILITPEKLQRPCLNPLVYPNKSHY